jgi:hypothetical protein
MVRENLGLLYQELPLKMRVQRQTPALRLWANSSILLTKEKLMLLLIWCDILAMQSTALPSHSMNEL